MTCPDCEKLQEVVDILRKENAELKARLEVVERKLALYENPHTPPSLRRRSYPERRSSSGKPGRKKGHEGVTRPQPKPDRTVEATLDKCPHCTGELGEPTHFESRLIEEIPEPQPVTVTEFKLAHYDCPSCDAEVVATHPDCPAEGNFGPRTLAHVTLLKYADRLPLRKVCETLERNFQLDLSAATILDMTRRSCAALKSEYDNIIDRIRAAKALYIDETSMKVSGIKFWLWTFVAEHDTLYVIRKSRGKKVLKKVLGRDYAGLIVCDGWKSYSNFTQNLQRCWSHMLREAKYLAEKVPEAVPLSRALHNLYERLKHIPATPPPLSERLLLHRNAVAVLSYWLGKGYKDEKLQKFITKLSNGRKHWFTFILNPIVEPTNNRAERALRESVVIRKIIGTLRNHKGTHIHETIMSLITTWKEQGFNISEKFVECLRLS